MPRNTNSLQRQLHKAFVKISFPQPIGSKSLTITLDPCLRILHLFEKSRIANNPRCIPNLATRLIQPRDNAYDSALGHIGELGDLLETCPLRPLPYDLAKTEIESARPPVPSPTRKIGNLPPVLYPPYTLGDRQDRIPPLFEHRSELRFVVRLFLENEGGQERGYFFWCVGRECILQDEFGKD